MSADRFTQLVTSINTLADSLRDLEKSDVEVSRFDQITGEVRRLLEGVHSPARQVRALAESEVGYELDAESISSVVDELDACLSGPTLAVDEIGAVIESRRRKLRSDIGKIEKTVKEVWNEEVRGALRSVLPPDMLDVARGFDASRAEELSEIRNELNSQLDHPPTDVERWHDLRKKRSRAEQLAAQIEDIPQGVQEFFRIVPRGFPLARLTPSVIEWLTEHKLIERFEIRSHDVARGGGGW